MPIGGAKCGSREGKVFTEHELIFLLNPRILEAEPATKTPTGPPHSQSAQNERSFSRHPLKSGMFSGEIDSLGISNRVSLLVLESASESRVAEAGRH